VRPTIVPVDHDVASICAHARDQTGGILIPLIMGRVAGLSTGMMIPLTSVGVAVLSTGMTIPC
jgi:hypothetical protein